MISSNYNACIVELQATGGFPASATLVKLPYQLRLREYGITADELRIIAEEMSDEIRAINGGAPGRLASRLGMLPCCLPCFFWNFFTLLNGCQRLQQIISEHLNRAVAEWQSRGIDVVFRQAQGHYERRPFSDSNRYVQDQPYALVFNGVAQQITAPPRMPPPAYVENTAKPWSQQV